MAEWKEWYRVALYLMHNFEGELRVCQNKENYLVLIVGMLLNSLNHHNSNPSLGCYLNQHMDLNSID